MEKVDSTVMLFLYTTRQQEIFITHEINSHRCMWLLLTREWGLLRFNYQIISTYLISVIVDF